MSFIRREIITAQQMWEDHMFPLIGRKIDVSSGYVDYDYYNCTLKFQTSAQFRKQESIPMAAQLPHCRALDTAIRPHIHWYQQSATEPNWLLAYKVVRNGHTTTIETDYSNYTLSKKTKNIYTYSSGVLCQITAFDELNISNLLPSDFIDFIFFRDSTNASGLFSGPDSTGITEHVKQFDIHYLSDTPGSGSTTEYRK